MIDRRQVGTYSRMVDYFEVPHLETPAGADAGGCFRPCRPQ